MSEEIGIIRLLAVVTLLVGLYSLIYLGLYFLILFYYY